MRRTILAAIALITLSSGAARAQQLMPDAQIRELLAGKSALFTDYSVATYGADGRYSYVAANNLFFKGKYTISNGRLCLAIERGTTRCDAIGTDASGPFMQASGGEKLRFSVTSAMAPQTVATLCNVPVAYTVQPPAPAVPERLRAFSGTWVGKWDYGLCTALIVESIRPDGTASLVYVNGSFGLEAPVKAASTRFQGTIGGGKLVSAGRTITLDFVMVDTNQLTATRTGPGGASTATFERRPQP